MSWPSPLHTCQGLTCLLLMVVAHLGLITGDSRQDSLGRDDSTHLPTQRRVLEMEAKSEKETSREDVIGVPDRPDSVVEDDESLGFLHSFVASFTVIIVSEFGDRTFLMAGVLAMRHSRLAVLLGSLAAMLAMTAISVVVGCATAIVPQALTHYAASVLFEVFGIKMLIEGWGMSANEGEEEYQEVQADMERRESQTSSQDKRTEAPNTPGFSAIFLQSLTLTLVAEWGDRSQISTIALAATEDAVGVMLGSFLGNALITALAVTAGRLLAEKVSVRTVTLVGGVMFNMFALTKLLHPPG